MNREQEQQATISASTIRRALDMINAGAMPPREELRLLQEGAALLDQKHEFAPGDVVQWKPGLCLMMSGNSPEARFIFRRYLDEPIKLTNDIATPYWAEPADCVILALKGEDIVEWATPSRRLRPADPLPVEPANVSATQ